MNKYSEAQDNIFSIFAKAEWKAEGIKAYPSLIVPDNPGKEYIRISIVPSEDGENSRSVSGLLLIDIFAESVKGPKRVMELADILDKHLNTKTVKLSTYSTQFMNSNLGRPSTDKDNPALSMTLYSIPFRSNANGSY